MAEEENKPLLSHGGDGDEDDKEEFEMNLLWKTSTSYHDNPALETPASSRQILNEETRSAAKELFPGMLDSVEVRQVNGRLSAREFGTENGLL